MKSLLLVFVFAHGLAASANAALVSRLGGQVVYDTDLDVTWLADANLAASNTFNVPGIDPVDGRMNWNTANVWISRMNLNNYLNFNGWRLPATLFPDPSCDGSTTPGSPGLNCSGSELGHLFYTEFGATGGTSVLDTGDSTELDKFNNLQLDQVDAMNFWSGTEFAESPSNLAWTFAMHNGLQWASDKTHGFHAWAVADGDVFVPLPPSLWLFGSGLIGLVGFARKKAA